MGNEKKEAIKKQYEEKVIRQNEEKIIEKEKIIKRHYEISESNTYVRDHKPRYTVESSGTKDIDILRMTGVNQSENKKE